MAEEKALEAAQSKLAEERRAFDEDARKQREAIDAERKDWEATKRRNFESRVNSTWLSIVQTGHAAPSDERTFKAVANGLYGQTEVVEFADKKGDALDALTESWMAREVIGKSKDAKGKAGGELPADPADRLFAEAEGIAAKQSISLVDALGEAHRRNPADYEAYHTASFKPLGEGK